jgi:hypothetical protein
MIRFVGSVGNTKQHVVVDQNSTYCVAWFGPEGIQSTEVLVTPMGDSQSPTIGSQERSEIKLCCYEWRGYREAQHVLEPFGYSAPFVQSILTGFPSETTANDSENNRYQRTSMAVRGATYARPDSYCPCWDSDFALGEEDGDDSLRKYNLAIRQKRRRLLQRQLLPRIILSSMYKDPLDPTLAGKQQPSIQFLNADGTNAVRLLTPRFHCGTVRGPITIFCIAIATEDGCFFSGLRERCEFGHLYPRNNLEHATDMSPVGIATNGATSADEQHESFGGMGCFEDDDDDDDDDTSANDNMQYRMIDPSSYECKCPFYPQQELCDGDTDGDDSIRPPDFLHRGKRCPGLWHCYVAVADGANSTIRVDGAEENMSHYSVGVWGQFERVALDGLTIGSDHEFDMSLCFGEGAPGEGEGAISELAVFKGRLPLEDIEALERHLMKKHGISRVVPGTELLLRQEDDWRRETRALVEQTGPDGFDTGGIPLRVVAKYHGVAWHRTSVVTGESISVGRIGSRVSNGSSDW